MYALLAQAITDTRVARVCSSEKSKKDLRFCRFEARNVLSCPAVLEHIGQSLGQIARTGCKGTPKPGIRLESRKRSADDIAYIFFTSGTSGRPKGVFDTHRNVLHNIVRYTNALAIRILDH
jgi:long-subunit acyl-CoA synthetase (AMP-forming)